MKDARRYSFQPPESDDRAAHVVHFLSALYTDALMKATGDSIGVAESSCAKLFSRAPVAILHVPADSAGPLSLARYIGVMRLAAPRAAPSARLRPEEGTDMDTPERAKGLSRKPRGWPTGSSSADTAGGWAWPAGCPRTARPPTSSNARAAGSRAAAWSAATPAANLLARRCSTCNGGILIPRA